MSLNTKTYIYLFYYAIIILINSILTFEVNAETKIIAKKGDTLFKISREYEVPLKLLMYKNNFNDAGKIIEGETIIIPLKDKNQYKENNDFITYKVIKGDTLYKISKDYNVKVKDIVLLNNLESQYLSINQIILLPKAASKNKDVSQYTFQQARKKVVYHLTSKTEDLSTIAKIHRITVDKIKTLNKLNSPSEIRPHIQLRLREKNISKWRKYGSLIINWSNWTYFDGNYLTKAKTKKNTSFYIATSCKRRALNNTLINSSWTNWYFPTTDFELKIINDFCDQEFIF
tara:strand:- start:180 stop:1040 length:861 start_codon:yes stop_codon:yes gene_type:complete